MIRPSASPSRASVSTSTSTSMREGLAIAADRERSVHDRIAAIKRVTENLDPEAIVPLAVIYSESSGALRFAIRTALKALSATEVTCAELAGARDPERRVRAAKILGRLADEASVPALIEALSDLDARVREQAAGALGAIKDESAVEALSKMLLLDPDPNARGAAAQALGELRDPLAARALEHATRREEDVFVVILIERALLSASERNEFRKLAACG